MPHRAILENPSLAQAIIHRMAEAVLIADDEGTYLDANEAAADLLGIPIEKLVGRSVLDVTPPEDHVAAKAAWKRFLDEGEMHGPYRVQRPDGSLRDVTFSAYAHVRPQRHVALLADVTDAQAGLRALAVARRQLAQAEKLSVLGTLTSGVAHEVRTPLTFLANNLYLIQNQLERAVREGEAPPALLDSLQTSFRDASIGIDRINHLVLELRRFSRLQPGERKPARLDVLVEDAVRLFTSTTRAYPVEQDIRPVDPIPVDASQMQQVMLNLLDNAADATSPGGKIRVEVRPQDGGGIVSVENDGASIPPEAAAHIFETFYTTKANGMGLGLGIVQRIVHAHGGSISWTNRPEGGTRFSFTIPPE